MKDKFQFSIYFNLSNKLETLELEKVSAFTLWFEAGGLFFLINFVVGVVLRPYSDFFLRRDLLNKTFKMDTSEKDKLSTPVTKSSRTELLKSSRIAPSPDAEIVGTKAE